MQLSDARKKKILDRGFGAIQHWLPRFNVMIIGPGLGRDEMVHDTIKQVLRSQYNFFLVVALCSVTQSCRLGLQQCF